ANHRKRRARRVRFGEIGENERIGARAECVARDGRTLGGGRREAGEHREAGEAGRGKHLNSQGGGRNACLGPAGRDRLRRSALAQPEFASYILASAQAAPLSQTGVTQQTDQLTPLSPAVTTSSATSVRAEWRRCISART